MQIESGHKFLRPRFVPADQGGAPGQPPPPDANSLIGNIAQQAIDKHDREKPHLSPDRVKQIATDEHDKAPHPGLARQVDIDILTRKVEQLEHASPPPLTSQDMATAVTQDPRPFVVALDPYLPKGQGGMSETDIRALAKDEIDQASAAKQQDGWVSPSQVEQLIQDALDSGVVAKGADLATLQATLTEIEQRLPSGTLTTAAQQRQAIAQLLGIPAADLDAARVKARIQTLAEGTPLSATQLDQIAANVATRLGLTETTPTALARQITTIANRELNRRSLFRFLRRPVVTPPPPGTTPPTTVVTTTTGEIDRRTLLGTTVGVGIGIVLCGVLWLLTHPNEPTPTISGPSIIPSTDTPIPSGLDYSSMSVDQANQILRSLPTPEYTGAGTQQIITETIPDGEIGIATGVIVNGISDGDTVAYEGGRQITVVITDGALYKVPQSQARDAFVALVVISEKVYKNMHHASPLPEWNLPSFG